RGARGRDLAVTPRVDADGLGAGILHRGNAADADGERRSKSLLDFQSAAVGNRLTRRRRYLGRGAAANLVVPNSPRGVQAAGRRCGEPQTPAVWSCRPLAWLF